MHLHRLSVPFSVLLVLLIAMVSAALSIVAYKLADEASHLSATQQTLRMSADTVQSIQGVLSSAKLVTRLTSHSTLTQQKDLESRLSQLGFIKEALYDSPTISSIFIGYETGDFFLVRALRDEQHSIALKLHPDTRFIVQSIERTDTASSKMDSRKGTRQPQTSKSGPVSSRVTKITISDRNRPSVAVVWIQAV